MSYLSPCSVHVGNSGSGLGQAQKCGRVYCGECDPNTPSLDLKHCMQNCICIQDHHSSNKI